MSDIPDEVRVELAKDYVRQNFESGEPWSMTVARAILAERNRCISIAQSTEPHNEAEAHLIETIVRRIRGDE